MMPLVSIIMPTYNCGHFIARSIDSVLAQTFQDWELLIIDDCSTDNTKEVVRQYTKDNPRIIYRCLEHNSGSAVARNTALKMAQGRYIAFLDSDDLWLPNKLAHQLRFMQENNYGFTYHEYTEIDEFDKPLNRYISGISHITPFHMYACCWPGCLSVMYDTHVVGCIQIEPIRKNNDSAIWLKAVHYTDCYLLKENLAQYRRRKGSITPASKWQKTRWTYRLFRDAEHKSIVVSLFWTLMNIIENNYKKIFYVYSVPYTAHLLSKPTETINNMVSVICPCLNEAKRIDTCLHSILRQDYDRSKLEVLFVDGMSTDSTREIIMRNTEQYPFVHLLDNPRHTAPFAMNIGIQAAQGEYIIRMDAHSVYPDNYISTLIRYLQTLPNAQNVGALCRTLPANRSKMAQAIAITSSHRFGVGNSHFRTGIDTISVVDTVPFGCWRKEWLIQIGGFDEELTRNQDDELNARTIQHGGSIYLIPDVAVDYYARENLSKTWNMFYQYGLFKPLVNKKLHRPATLRQFVPPLFVLFCWTVLPIYACILICFALWYHNIALLLTFPAVHFSYGIGYWCGICKLLTHNSLQVTINH